MEDSKKTMRAALMSRRSLLKSAAAIGAVGLASPAYVKNAFSSSGELTYMGWSGYDYKIALDPFTAATGIKVNFVEQPDQDAMFAQAKLALQTGDLDMVEPTVERTGAWVSNGLIQPWDTNKLVMENYLPGMADGMAGEMAQIDGKRYHVPCVWGTEGLVFSKTEAPLTYGTASLGDLFDDKYVGKVCLRAHSSLAAMGRWLDSTGKLPKPFIDGYKDEATMKELWDIALTEAIKKKANVVQFWKGENEAQAAYRTNGAVIGLNWDSTGYNLRNDGFGYISPKEGFFAWNQGMVVMANAKNVEQAHELAKWVSTAQGAAAWAKMFSANPVGRGAVELGDPEVLKFYNEAMPEDALSKLWWWPTQEAWFLKLRAEYADKFQAA